MRKSEIKWPENDKSPCLVIVIALLGITAIGVGSAWALAQWAL